VAFVELGLSVAYVTDVSSEVVVGRTVVAGRKQVQFLQATGQIRKQRSRHSNQLKRVSKNAL